MTDKKEMFQFTLNEASADVLCGFLTLAANQVTGAGIDQTELIENLRQRHCIEFLSHLQHKLSRGKGRITDMTSVSFGGDGRRFTVKEIDK